MAIAFIIYCCLLATFAVANGVGIWKYLRQLKRISQEQMWQKLQE